MLKLIKLTLLVYSMHCWDTLILILIQDKPNKMPTQRSIR